MDIAQFESFLAQLLTQTRRALFGTVSSVYFDIERQSPLDTALLGERKASSLSQVYPYLAVKKCTWYHCRTKKC